MLYREIIAVCSEIHIKHINTLFGQNVEFVNAKLVVHTVTTGLYILNGPTKHTEDASTTPSLRTAFQTRNHCFRLDRDWGLAQLDTVRERPAVNSSLFAALTNFGYHGLHHLFPAVDHSRLPLLYPALKKTCEEFRVSFAEYSLLEMYKGQFQQIARNTPNLLPPGHTDVGEETRHA
jgi:hypothetical protein